MAGIKAFRKIQLGKETTAGTAVAATAIWRGIGTIKDDLTTVFPVEDIGILGGVTRSYIPKTLATLMLEAIEATYEQLPYLFECGIEHVVTPTTDAAGYAYAYTMPVASTDAHVTTDLQTFTFEGGDNQQAEEFAYGFATNITLAGAAGEAVKMSATIQGRQVGTSTFTAALAIPSVEEILVSKGKLYIDPTTDTIGTTQISNSMLDFTLNIATGWTPVWTADGAIYFSFIKQTAPVITLNITFEHDTSSVAEVANWRAGTPVQIRLNFDGTSSKELTLDMAGLWHPFDKLGERDGNDILGGTFNVRYDSDAALFFEAVVCNANASIT